MALLFRFKRAAPFSFLDILDMPGFLFCLRFFRTSESREREGRVDLRLFLGIKGGLILRLASNGGEKLMRERSEEGKFRAKLF